VVMRTLNCVPFVSGYNLNLDVEEEFLHGLSVTSVRLHPEGKDMH
jgi:hypothetical protein